MRKRVVITGMGVMTPLGNDVSTFWQALLAGKSGVGPITMYDASQQDVRIAAEVKDFEPVSVLGRKRVRRTNRFSQLALLAARQAVTDSRNPAR